MKKVASRKPVIKKIPPQNVPMLPVIIIGGFCAVVFGMSGYAIGKEALYFQQLSSQHPMASLSPDPMANWQTYTSQDNVLTFKAPAGSLIEVSPGYIRVKFGNGTSPDELHISYATNGKKPVGYSGTAAGEATEAGQINFIGGEIDKTKLIPEAMTAEILYGCNTKLANCIISREKIKFLITLNWGLDSKNGIPAETETLADQILSTVQIAQ